MSAAREVISQLECSLQNSSSAERLQMLRSITELYLGSQPADRQEHTELFDQALDQLIDYVDTQALTTLSAELAPVYMAPLRVVQRLARHNDIAVAGPLLRESKCLGTADLNEIAATKSQGHLAAIGSRPEVEEVVTDVLVDRGNEDVARIIAANSGCRFSQTGFSNLVTRAEKEVGLAEIVAIRAEMKPHHFRQLLVRASNTVRRRLMSISDPRAHAAIKKATAKIAREINSSLAPQERDYSKARHLLSSMRSDKDRLRSKLLEFASQKKFEETIVTLAILANLDVTAVEKLVTKSDGGGILVLCKGIGVDWPTTRAISLVICPAASEATVGTELFRQFELLTPLTARRVLRFWQVRASVAAHGRT